MTRINAAIIGMGFAGKLHYDALRRLPRIHVRTIVVHKSQDIPLIREHYDADIIIDDWREAVADPLVQVIHNCTPNHLHDEINLAAIAAGKHIYAEKPMSLTTEGAVLEMRSRIRRGEAGRPLYVSGCYLQESVARKTDYTKRRIPETSPARAVLDIGIHWADTAAFVMGCPIQRVYSRVHIHHPIRTDPETGREIHVRSDDTTAILVEFADGTPGSALFSKCMLGHKNDLTVTVSGDRREISWHQEQCDRLLVGNRETGNETIFMDRLYSHPETAPFIAMPPGHAPGWQDAQKNALLAFYSSIETGSYRTGEVSYATFADGIWGNRFVDAVLRSSRENRWIDL